MLLVLALVFYLFAPYILVYLGINVLLNARRYTGGGFIDIPIVHLAIGEPLIWLGHHISSRGTLWMIDHGSEKEKKFAVHILDRWPNKSDVLKLISYAKKENNKDIKYDLIYAIGRCKNDRALPFLEKLFRKGEDVALIAMCKMQTNLAEKKLLEIYKNTNTPEFKELIWIKGNHSFRFAKDVILTEKSFKMRFDAYWGYLTSQNNKFNETHKGVLWPFNKACSEWCYKDTFTPSDLIKSFDKHPELSLAHKKILLLGHAVLRSPKSIPFLKEISTKSKSEALRKLAKEILKVIPSELPKISKDLKNKK